MNDPLSLKLQRAKQPNDNRMTMNDNKLHLIISLLIIIVANSSCKTFFNKDHSLKPEEYQQLGMPDYKKVWTNDDYISSNITLSSLKMNDPLSLPRKNSRKSGVLFKRMVNEGNLAFIHDTIFPLRTRAYTIQYYPRFQSEMEQMYTIEYQGRMYYSEELPDLHIFGLIVHDKMLELGWIIDRSDDKDVASIKGGMTAVRYNYLKLIPRLLGELAKSEQYSIEDICRLSKSISASITKNSEWMTSSEKEYLLEELKKAAETIKSPGINENLKSCTDVLNR